MTSSDPSDAPGVSAASGGRFAEYGEAGKRLAAALASGRTPHAVLLEGPDAVAPREAALRFAAGLLCSAPAASTPRPCGACRSCARAARGSHADLHLQGLDKATVISVEALQALLDRAHASPLEGPRQVFVIDPADALAPEGVGRYLKTLEEPPASTTFLLVTARPDRLPDTVRSRCQRVRFAPPAEAEIAARLVSHVGGGRVVPSDRAARIARLSGGSHARAARFLALGVDEVVDALVASARAEACSAATAAERALETLKHRAAALGAGDPDASSGAPPGATPDAASAGEALRQALDDVFHALLATARDRAAVLGEAARGPLGAASADEAASALVLWGRLAPLVRRNLSPSSLLIEAVAAARRHRVPVSRA